MPTKKEKKEIKKEEIECDPAVIDLTIHEYIGHCKDCKRCKAVVETARFKVTKANKSLRENISITCLLCDHALEFYAGKRQNKYVVQSVKEEVHVTPVKQTWREWWNEMFKNNSATFKDISVFVVKATLLNEIGGPVVEVFANLAK